MWGGFWIAFNPCDIRANPYDIRAETLSRRAQSEPQFHTLRVPTANGQPTEELTGQKTNGFRLCLISRTNGNCFTKACRIPRPLSNTTNSRDICLDPPRSDGIQRANVSDYHNSRLMPPVIAAWRSLLDPLVLGSRYYRYYVQHSTRLLLSSTDTANPTSAWRCDGKPHSHLLALSS